MGKKLLFFVTFFSTSLLAQNPYYKTEDIKWGVGFALTRFFNAFSFRQPINDTTILHTRLEATKGGSGIWLKYKKWPAVFISLIPSISDTLVRTRGLKVFLNLIVKKKLLLSGSLSLLKGYIYSHTSAYFDSLFRYKFAAINSSAINLGIHAAYIFRGDECSFKFAYTFGERQLQTRASWIIMMGYNRISQYNAEKIDTLFTASLTNYRQFQGNALSFSGGGMINWIPEAFRFKENPNNFVSLGGSLLLGLAYTQGKMVFLESLPTRGFRKINFVTNANVYMGLWLDSWIIRINGIAYYYNYDPLPELSLQNMWSNFGVHIIKIFR